MIISGEGGHAELEPLRWEQVAPGLDGDLEPLAGHPKTREPIGRSGVAQAGALSLRGQTTWRGHDLQIAEDVEREPLTEREVPVGRDLIPLGVETDLSFPDRELRRRGVLELDGETIETRLGGGKVVAEDLRLPDEKPHQVGRKREGHHLQGVEERTRELMSMDPEVLGILAPP